MKKIMTYFISAFAIVLFASANLFAPPKLASKNDTGGGGGFGTGPCDMVLGFEVPLVNLDQVYGSNENLYNFPPANSHYADMYLRITIDGAYFSYVEPVNNFEFSHSSNWVNVYIAEVIFEMNLCYLCENEMDFHKLSVLMELINLDGTPYRSCAYTGPNDIFACSYFGEGNCGKVPDSNTIMCNQNNLNVAEDEISMECRNMGDGDGGFGFGLNMRSRSVTNEISIYPNPFSEAMTVNIPDDFLGGKLKVIDVSGNLVQSLELNVKQNTKTLHTINYTAGVYTLIIENEGHRVMNRIVKN